MFAIAENPLPSGLDTFVEERIANIGIHLEVFGTYFFNDFFFAIWQYLEFWLFASQPTVHYGGISRGTVCPRVSILLRKGK